MPSRRYGKHLIGMAVDLKKGTITLFHCGLPTEDKNNDISQIEDLAVLIPALMMEAFGEEVNKKEVVPYKIEKAKLKVTCILPPIPNDPEADVCIEDIADKCLEDIADLSKRDYKFKIREWDNMSIDLYAANEEIRRASLLFGNGEMGQASSSYPEESVESKINRISQMMEDNFRIMNTRLCLIEKDSKEIKSEESRVRTLFELGENVEIASGRKWYPGNVLKTYMLNGVEMVTVEYSTLFLDKKKKTKRLQENVSSDRIRPQQPSEKLGERLSFELMDKVEAYHNDGWCSGQREEKRPIGPRNPPMPVTPEVILPIDPFVTPEFPRFSRLGYWMGLRGIYCVAFYINGREKEKDFFEYMDNAENNIKEEHIDAAFAMLNCKRIEQSTWFRNKSLPEACFVPVQFLESVGYSYGSLKKPTKKGIQILKGSVGEIVRGLKTPRKIWLEDVDVVYGVVHERKSDHYIGVEIHLMDNTITLFHCGLHQKGIRVENTPLIKQLAVKKAEGLPKTRFPFNCGIFVVKMLECKSLRLKNMTNINDDNAMDLRSKPCCEIFDQFMDKDFQEVSTK
ncbi:hypothetical protein Bca52824_035180 [Brassica carinata]|uniref:Uncharacterized protein n=1 Tax=Brassica carinata TaxID=52824 RepID=A0A8X7S2P5_BRACI|nr:hypothetical protein Bca52824_035180 [Brassica carinata]